MRSGSTHIVRKDHNRVVRTTGLLNRAQSASDKGIHVLGHATHLSGELHLLVLLVTKGLLLFILFRFFAQLICARVGEFRRIRCCGPNLSGAKSLAQNIVLEQLFAGVQRSLTLKKCARP